MGQARAGVDPGRGQADGGGRGERAGRARQVAARQDVARVDDRRGDRECDAEKIALQRRAGDQRDAQSRHAGGREGEQGRHAAGQDGAADGHQHRVGVEEDRYQACWYPCQRGEVGQ